MSELKKFVLVVKYGERDLFFSHHTIKVTGRSIDGSISEWHSEDSTFLPRSIAITQDVHSGRRNGALYGRKRRFTALIFTLFHRNPSVRITTAVYAPFCSTWVLCPMQLRRSFLWLLVFTTSYMANVFTPRKKHITTSIRSTAPLNLSKFKVSTDFAMFIGHFFSSFRIIGSSLVCL
jgi:hypothetical protein